MIKVRQIVHQGQLLAIIVPASYSGTGIEFFTPDEFSQQLGYMKRPKGYVVEPHDHNPVERVILWTQEVLILRSGKVRLDIYTSERHLLESHILNAGDIAMLAQGGHGLVMLEESEIVEVKQGPYVADCDKTRFTPLPSSQEHVRI